MKLADVVKNKDYPTIEYRVSNGKDNEVLFGFCSYKKGILKSLDGDDYSLDDEIMSHRMRGNTLVVVQKVEWL